MGSTSSRILFLWALCLGGTSVAVAVAARARASARRGIMVDKQIRRLTEMETANSNDVN